uniref:Cytoplasmic envelopment protein 3 n=1 Tax=Mastomys natalensis cytomegalovirus 2 TaxID=2973540 RepID=A0A9Y1IM55_9BETA|nr:myristylated tegument protein [Mastomys natalensis cytomegalovirus 2]WEG69234.1 myristylated tegument protein [Mastomys natalensis cytomegalovirus 2]WEG69373.1 myristylated tegument protein [Mastomys natalensis cytomegalovirus 2]WEG69511.1 myristylated tegument protein [Mastomys natalensis cytomegalovirus 2]WEG69649.1 myristylated tegument protein [Mastomys natalensis cytomegalovirus 2]
MGAECCKRVCCQLHPGASDSLKDSSGKFVQLGSEFSVLTDTSDDDEDRTAPDRDDSKQRLLGSVPENAIPTTVPVRVQTGPRSGDRGGRRVNGSAKSGSIKKKARAIL